MRGPPILKMNSKDLVIYDLDSFQDYFGITSGVTMKKRPALRRCLKFHNGQDHCEFHLKFNYKLNQAPPYPVHVWGASVVRQFCLALSGPFCFWVCLVLALSWPVCLVLFFGLPCTGGLVRSLGALDPVISKDFMYVSKIVKDDHELTPEEMSTLVDVRAEGCGARRWFLQQF